MGNGLIAGKLTEGFELNFAGSGFEGISSTKLIF